MEEQFILRVPPAVAERIERLFAEASNAASSSSVEDASLDLSFSEDGRSGTFMIGNESFPAALLDLPCVVESFKTYDDSSLIKTADIGQMIMVREEGDPPPDGVECKDGLTPPMRDARRRRFRREPELNPELVQRVEGDLIKIMSGGTAGSILSLSSKSIRVGSNAAATEGQKADAAPASKPEELPAEAAASGEDPDRSDSEDSVETES